MKRSVVIGAGPAGISTAITLSGDRDRRVIVVDRGGSGGAATTRWPLRGDRTRPYYVGGCGLGGGALVNAGVLGPDRGPIAGIASRPAALGPIGAALVANTDGAEPVRVLDVDTERSVAAALGLVASERALIEVHENCAANRLLFDGNRVEGVVTDRGELLADEVYLAAGAVSTPLLLLDSGVVGVGIGDGLRDHPAITVSVPTDSATDTDDGLDDGGQGRVRVSAVADVHDGSAPDRTTGMIYAVEDLGADHDPRRGLILALFDSERVGRVRRCPTTGAPEVDLGPFVDGARLAGLWERFRRVLGEGALADLFADATVDEWGTRAVDVGSDEALQALVDTGVGGLYHAAGTTSAAVDQDGQLLGYRGLYVADISRLARPPAWPMQASIASGRALARRRLTR